MMQENGSGLEEMFSLEGRVAVVTGGTLSLIHI